MSARLTHARPRGHLLPRLQTSTRPHPRPRPIHTTTPKLADSQSKKITITPAVPFKKWSDLSTAQKAGRTVNTGFNFVTIVAGTAITGAVFTLLYLEVFAPDSAANWFNRIHDRVRADEKCAALLGNRIKAYGEPTANRWSRNRPIASRTWKDKYGIEHLTLHFNVEGHIDRGTVHAHLIRRPTDSKFSYRHLYVDITGKPRIHLEKHDDKPEHEGGPRKRLFGIQWGW